ncbi:major capsid protein [Butyricimonas paravirosa]|jgi:hypothetical protein|uniref:major capsid protein n=1 Tax=Butyricimonas paravirosa TaxID=1472417 RepID=UPI00351FD8AE
MENLHSFGHLRNNPSRSPFDLAVKKVFSAKAGMLLPVYWRLTLPKQTFNIGRQHFTRTRPVQTAAFTRIKEYFDWYYVPLRLISKNLPPALVQMQDNPVQASSITTSKVPTLDLPYVSLATLSDFLNVACSESASTGVPLDAMGFPVVSGMFRMLDLFRYGSVFASEAVQTKVLKDYTTAPADAAGTNYWVYGQSINVHLLPFLTYQKIYSDHFRFEQWEYSEPYTYNVDYYTGGNLFSSIVGSTSSILGYLRESNIFSLRYANWKKDYFTGVMPSPQLGDVAMISVGESGSQIPVMISPETVSVSGGVTTEGSVLKNISLTDPPTVAWSNVVNTTGQKALVYRDSVQQQAQGMYVDSSSLGSAFSVIQLRIAEALQKYKEVSQCNGQTYRDQIYAHFGARLSAALSDESQFIGGSDSSIDLSEVVNTNLQGEGEPTISGKGVGSGRDSFSFTAPEHGVIMCIYHVEPVLDYAISGVHPLLTFTQTTDLPIPEFDHIGMEGVPLFSLMNAPVFSDPTTITREPMGYSSRYLPWKADIDTVHGAFRTTLVDWVAPMTDSLFYKSMLLGATHPTGPDTDAFNTYNFFKVNPSVLDPIFAIEADKTVDTDQFLVNCFFDVKTVAPLDYNGMPY